MGHAITAGGQVTIPDALLNKLGLRPGDEVEVLLEADGRLLLRRAESPAASYRACLERVAGSFRMPDGMSTDEFLGMTRGERDDL